MRKDETVLGEETYRKDKEELRGGLKRGRKNASKALSKEGRED